jgi:hypothetical protein
MEEEEERERRKSGWGKGRKINSTINKPGIQITIISTV